MRRGCTCFLLWILEGRDHPAPDQDAFRVLTGLLPLSPRLPPTVCLWPPYWSFLPRPSEILSPGPALPALTVHAERKKKSQSYQREEKGKAQSTDGGERKNRLLPTLWSRSLELSALARSHFGVGRGGLWGFLQLQKVGMQLYEVVALCSGAKLEGWSHSAGLEAVCSTPAKDLGQSTIPLFLEKATGDIVTASFLNYYYMVMMMIMMMKEPML